MLLNLSEIIEMPDGAVPFECELSIESLPGVARFAGKPHAEGQVRNMAGALILEAVITADMVCVCDRCGAEFDSVKVQNVSVPVAADLVDKENADIFHFEGDVLDIDEVLNTCLILDMETKFLCRPDCAGLCQTCGANLNDGPCPCPAEIDPRLAVLEQLLDIEND